jgi:hypothetical protein
MQAPPRALLCCTPRNLRKFPVDTCLKPWRRSSLAAGLALSAALLALPVRADDAIDTCPMLPAGSGLTWHFARGADFAVCYATYAGSAATVIGVYLGNAPEFDPALATAVRSGSIGGHQVTWFRRDSASGNAPMAVQTVVVVNRRYMAHVWVNADTEAELSQRLALIERMALRN